MKEAETIRNKLKNFPHIRSRRMQITKFISTFHFLIISHVDRPKIMVFTHLNFLYPVNMWRLSTFMFRWRRYTLKVSSKSMPYADIDREISWWSKNFISYFSSHFLCIHNSHAVYIFYKVPVPCTILSSEVTILHSENCIIFSLIEGY